MKITKEFFEKIKMERELHHLIYNTITLAMAVSELQESVAAIEAHLGLNKNDEIRLEETTS